MLILNPQTVTFASTPWPDVRLVAIERRSTRQAVDHDDHGPHAVFADAPEQITTVRVVRDIARDDPDSPRPGDRATLTFHASPGNTRSHRRRFQIDCVVLASTYELGRGGTTRTIRLAAIAPAGDTDPITITEAP